jgi:deoxycytidylate deaminase
MFAVIHPPLKISRSHIQVRCCSASFMHEAVGGRGESIRALIMPRNQRIKSLKCQVAWVVASRAKQWERDFGAFIAEAHKKVVCVSCMVKHGCTHLRIRVDLYMKVGNFRAHGADMGLGQMCS